MTTFQQRMRRWTAAEQRAARAEAACHNARLRASHIEWILAQGRNPQFTEGGPIHVQRYAMRVQLPPGMTETQARSIVADRFAREVARQIPAPTYESRPGQEWAEAIYEFRFAIVPEPTVTARNRAADG